jgi:hypothetical protein
MGPGGSGLPGALGACALARMMDARRTITGKTRWIKQDPFLSSQFSELDVFRVLWSLFFWFSMLIGSRFLELV